MSDKHTSICVIGGAGFIGTYVTRLLDQLGRSVTVLGRHDRSRVAVPNGVRYLAGDYGDPAALQSALRGNDAVVDLAYSTVPQTSFDDPVFDIVSNLPPSVRLLQEAARAGIRKVVMASSGGTVYGIATLLPIGEDHPTNPISPYGITKLTIEKYAGMFGLTSGLPIVIVRPGNAYGEGQRAFSGQGFVATAIHSVIHGMAVPVYGPFGTIRDYVHVSDIARGIVAALDHGQAGEIYNIGSGEGSSNLDVLALIEPLAKSSGYDVRTTTLPARTFDVPANVLDSRKLTAVSGWLPAIELAEGIGRAWRFAQDTGDR
ncbi:MAG: NAD-dependent epimerase/dehydratase family protein [Chloroflexota bacterium]